MKSGIEGKVPACAAGFRSDGCLPVRRHIDKSGNPVSCLSRVILKPLNSHLVNAVEMVCKYLLRERTMADDSNSPAALQTRPVSSVPRVIQALPIHPDFRIG